jgi:hypothetical protein
MMKHLIILSVMLLIASAGNAYSQNTNKDRQEGNDVLINLDKGDLMFGGTVGLNLRSMGNTDQLIRIVDIEDQLAFNIRIDGAYAVKDEVFLGLGINYGQTNRTGDYINPDNGELSNISYFAYSVSLKPFVKNHLPLDRIGRFCLVNITEFMVQVDQSIAETTTNNLVTRDLSVSQEYGIGVRPGLMVFMVKNFAVEATVNLAGVTYQHSRISSTGQPDEIVSKAGIDLKIDLLQLNLGFLIYL